VGVIDYAQQAVVIQNGVFIDKGLLNGLLDDRFDVRARVAIRCLRKPLRLRPRGQLFAPFQMDLEDLGALCFIREVDVKDRLCYVWCG
jgi:hypothetical protein